VTGEELRALRTALRLKQEELAKIVGLTRQTIIHAEKTLFTFTTFRHSTGLTCAPPIPSNRPLLPYGFVLKEPKGVTPHRNLNYGISGSVPRLSNIGTD
jgi:hypothetical protein